MWCRRPKLAGFPELADLSCGSFPWEGGVHACTHLLHALHLVWNQVWKHCEECLWAPAHSPQRLHGRAVCGGGLVLSGFCLCRCRGGDCVRAVRQGHRHQRRHRWRWRTAQKGKAQSFPVESIDDAMPLWVAVSSSKDLDHHALVCFHQSTESKF